MRKLFVLSELSQGKTMKVRLRVIFIVAFCFCLLGGKPAFAVTPIFSFSNTQQSSTTDGGNTDTYIPAAQLENGKKYLILYSAAYGGAGTSDEVGVRVEYGSTVIARGSDEGSSSGSPEAMRDASLQGFYILTGDGSSDLRIKFTRFSGTCYVKGKSLIAIPLEDLTENSDYWYSQQNGDAAQQTATNSWVDLLTMTKDLPETGDYLVLMSAEGWLPSGSTSDGEAFRAVIEASIQKAAMGKEWETNNASRSFSYARIHNLNSGNNTFGIEVGSAQGSASKSFRRGRIVVIRAGAFDQITSTSNDTDNTTTANYPTYDDFITQTYTPNQQEYVVVIGNTWTNQGQDYRSIIVRLENSTDNTYFSDFISDDSKDINIDRAMLSVFGAEQISSQKTYALQISGESSYSTAHHFQYGDLIVWSMTPGGPPIIRITNAEDENFLPNETDIDIQGILFGATQGTGKVELGDDPDYATATKVSQAINSWSDTLINIDLVLGGLPQGTLYLFVTNDNDEVSPAYTVTVQIPPSNVSRVGSWSTGLSHIVGSGSNRLLVFALGYEHSSDLGGGASSVTYGGQSLTLIKSDYVLSASGYVALAELWYLNEAGINAASGNTFSVTWTGGTPAEPYYGAATYQNVDQANPIGDTSSTTVDGSSPNPITTSVNVVANGLSVATAQCGNTGSYTWNNGWIEGYDQSVSSANNSVADKQDSTDGTSTASATHSGPNRQAIVAASLLPAAANQPPELASIGSKNVDEGQTLEFRVSASDPDGDVVTLMAEDVPTNATFVDSGNGAGSFSFSPDYDQSGVYNVTFIASDGLLVDSELVAITVNNINRSPVLDSIGLKSVDEGQSLEFRVSSSDPDGDALTLSAEDVPTNASFVDSGNGAGSFSFNPDYDQAGAYNVTFIVSDGTLADSELVAITVNDVNRSPVLDSIGAKSVDEAQTLEFRVSATDPDGDAVTFTADDVPTNGTFVDSGNGAGSFTFNPDYNQSGVYNVTFIASDGLLVDSELVAITVNNINRSPVLDSIGVKSVDEAQTLEFRVSSSDPDGNALSLSAEDVPSNATFVDSGNGAGSFTFNPDYDQSGAYNVTFITSDGTLADSELVAITVNNVNRAPVADAGSDQLNVEAGSLVTLDGSGSSDPDGDSIGYHWSQVSGLTVTLSDTNAINPTFTPDVKGNYEFELWVDDGTLTSSPDTVLVSVANQAPVLDSIGSKSVDEGQTLEFRASSTDGDGDSIILSAEDIPANGTFIDSGNGAGSFTFNPDYDQDGVYNVTFIASDGSLADSELVAVTVNNINRSPVLDSIKAKSVDEGQTLEFRVSASDPDGDAVTLTAEDVPTNATFVDSGNGAGSFSFNPDYDQSEVYNVTFIASDGILADSELVAITVNNINRSPVLDSIGARSLNEGQSLEFRVTATDPDGDVPTLSAEDVPVNATFIDSGNGAGSFAFNPDYDQAGAYNVTFIASDGTLADSELVYITVNDVNRSPVLDSIGARSVDEAQTLEFRVSSSDPDGDALTLSVEDVPINATFIDSGNGAASFTFNPTYDQAGAYNVTFITTDGSLADSELVIITVNDVNRSPVLDSIGSRSVLEGSHLGFTLSASDPDEDALTLTAENVPLNSTFTDSGNGKGSFEFDPNYTQSGLYYVTFKANDGDLADSEVVEIMVIEAGNQSPVLDSIGSKTVAEAETLIFKIHAIDPDGIPIPALAAYNRPANSTFVDSGNGKGSFRFYPTYDQAGIYNVTFVATDGSLADTEVVKITVTEVNRTPILSSIGSKSVNEGDVLEFRVSATDPDNDSLILSAEDVPTNATFVDSGNGAGSFTFNPDYTQSGVYNVTFIVSDGVLGDSELVQVTVNEAGNQAPVLDSIGSRSVDEAQTLEFRISATDPENDSLILSAVDVPANAVFVDSGNGAGSFSFNPDYDQSGVHNVTFIVSDGSLADSELVAITVNNVNRIPVADAGSDQLDVDAGSLVTLDGSGSSDPDGDSLGYHWSQISGPTVGLSDTNAVDPSFTPDIKGNYEFELLVDDGTLVSSPDSVLVSVGNQAPVLNSIGSRSVDEAQTLEFRVSASDPDGDALTLSAEEVPLNATFVDSGNGAGSFTFNPTYDQSRVYNVTFIVSDGGLADSELVSITVNDVNRSPVLDSIGSRSVDEAQSLEFRVSSSDPDGDALTLTAEDVPASAAFIDSGNGAGSFTFNPDYDQSGVYNVTFIVSDGTLADSELVVITVNDINRSPVLDSIGSKTVNEGEILEFRVSATDPDGDALTLSAEDVPANASFVDSGNGAGSFTFNPDYDQVGAYNVTFIASDGSLADSELVNITVNETNRAPIAVAGLDQSGIEANTLVTLDGSGSYDPDGDSISHHWTQISGPSVSLSDSTNIQPTFTPTVKGTYIFQLTVNDGSLDSQPDSVTVSVNNQSPVADAGSDQLGIKVNALVILDGSGSYDPDGDSLSYEWLQISGPMVNLSDSTMVDPTFTPTLTGDYLFQLIVSDGLIFSQPDTVLINVPAPPQAVGDLMATISGDYVLISWSAVTADTSGKATSIDRYVIYRGTKAYFTPNFSDSIGYTDNVTLSFIDSDIGGANVVGDVNTNYYYVIKVVDIFGNYSDVSNRVGEYDYGIVVTPTTDFCYITLPFTGTGIIDADDLIGSIGASNVNNVNIFVQSSQSYQARFAAGYGTNFSVVPGGIYQVNAKNSTVWSIAGAIPLAGSISYSIITTPTTDFSFISIPFEDEDIYQTAQDVIDSLPGALNTLNNFIPSSQSWESRFAAGYGKNFNVKPGGVYQANAKASATFPPGE